MVVKQVILWNAYRYIYENGIIEDKANPFYSGDIEIKVKEIDFM